MSAEVYPSPAEGKLNLDLKLGQSRQLTVTLLNSVGQVTANWVQNDTYSSGNYTLTKDVSDLKPGVYFIRVNTGKDSHVRKFIKK